MTINVDIKILFIMLIIGMGILLVTIAIMITLGMVQVGGGNVPSESLCQKINGFGDFEKKHANSIYCDIYNETGWHFNGTRYALGAFERMANTRMPRDTIAAVK